MGKKLGGGGGGSGGKMSLGASGGKAGKKPSKVGSKVRRANKKAAEAGPRGGEVIIPAGAGGGARASVDVDAIDWTQVKGWSKVRYDPNRLIHGAQEEGFVELEEISMKDIDFSALTPKPAADFAPKRAAPAAAPTRAPVDVDAVDWTQVKGWSKVRYDPNRLIQGAQEAGFVELEEISMKDIDFGPAGSSGGKEKGAGKGTGTGKGAVTALDESQFETMDLSAYDDHDGDFDEDIFPLGGGSDDDDAPESTPSNAPNDRKELSAKEARIEKRKARWKAKVEAAKARKAEARAAAAAGGAKPGAKKTKTTDEEEYVDEEEEDDDASDDEDEKRESAGDEAAAATTTAEAKGDAAAAGWQMDYNNYPTSGMGAVVDGVDLDAGADVSNWLEFDLHPKLLRALQDMGFTDPTPIQRECLNPAVKGRCDVIGAAETGSGKTLAFGLPILHRLLTQRDEEADESETESESEPEPDADGSNAADEEEDPFALIEDEHGRRGSAAGMKLSKRRKALRALIVAPTRELAMQVCDMLKSVARHADVNVVPVVGGMSLQKQERLLRRRPEIVVATPGRLWELMHQQNHEHFADLGRLQFLVLDEADRMVERGHFAELSNVIETLPMPPRIKRPQGAAKATPETLKVFKKRGAANAHAEAEDTSAGKRGGKGKKGGNAEVVDRDIVDGDGAGVEVNLRPSQMLDRQTFVFSATLTVPDNVRRKLKKRQAKMYAAGGDDTSKGKKASEKAAASGAQAGTLGALMEAVPFYGRVKLVDLTDQSNTVAKRVLETSLECTEDERDALLYHILSQQPGLVIVFVNAISALRRLLSILKILRLPVEGLHGNMQQRARLKYLDRFRAASGSGAGAAGARRTSVLVATDVAARGIDIKGVDLVVHYQVPMSADTYVHRSGRTGRAKAEGASVVLVTPSERQRYRHLLRALKRDAPLPAFPTVETAVAEAKRRLSLARRLDKIQHTKQKDSADAEWRRTNAAELGIELDSDEEADADAVLTFTNAEKRTKAKLADRAARAFAKAAARKKKSGKADDVASDGDSDGDSDSSDLDEMEDLVQEGFDPDDQASAERLGQHRRLGREEAKLRAELDEMLKTSLGKKAERRMGVASAMYPSRGNGGARMAAAAEARRGGGDGSNAGGDGSNPVDAVKMLKGGKKAAAAFGAAPGGAMGKKRKRAKVAAA